MEGYRLLIPGPVDVAPEVLEPMSSPMEPHYGDRWTKYYNETLGLTQKVFRTDGDIFLMPGTGSAAIEACLATAAGGGGKALILNNGVCGDRMEAIMRSHSGQVEVIKFPIGTPVDIDQVEKTLSGGQFDLVGMTHCETSIGMLNPIKEIGALCRKYGVLFMVDAVSSLGVDRLEMDNWHIGLCATGSQKGLETPPGLAVAAVGKSAWKYLEKFTSPGWYLNLKLWRRYARDWGDWHPFPITMAVNNVKSFRAGLERILAEGMDARERRHEQVSAYLRRGLEAIGFEMCIPQDQASHGVIAVKAHPDISVDDLLGWVKTEKKLLMAGSLGELKGKIFRIGLMGPSADTKIADIVIDALKEALDRAGR